MSLRHKLLNYNPKNHRILKSDALPTLNLSFNKEANKHDIKRSCRLTKRRRKEEVKEIIQELLPNPISCLDRDQITDVLETPVENIIIEDHYSQ